MGKIEAGQGIVGKDPEGLIACGLTHRRFQFEDGQGAPHAAQVEQVHHAETSLLSALGTIAPPGAKTREIVLNGSRKAVFTFVIGMEFASLAGCLSGVSSSDHATES
jgi:hypothetical protein